MKFHLISEKYIGKKTIKGVFNTKPQALGGGTPILTFSILKILPNKKIVTLKVIDPA